MSFTGDHGKFLQRLEAFIAGERDRVEPTLRSFSKEMEDGEGKIVWKLVANSGFSLVLTLEDPPETMVHLMSAENYFKGFPS